MSTILEVKNLCKSYNHEGFALKNVSFSVPKGCIVGFVGKNGAGKTTTVNSILNIIEKDSGTVEFFGQEMTDKNFALRNDIGVVFDATNFSGELTPKQLEKVVSDIYKNWDKTTFFGLLEKLSVPANKKIKTFSRGMTMKLSIIVALSHGSKFLILDEATSGLDPIVREEMLDLFLEFVEDENHSILMSSHITGDLEKVADYIIFINDGQIILTEKKDTLIYEYGIARCKSEDFSQLETGDFIAHRKRGLQIDVLLADKASFFKKYPHITVDNGTIDEILRLMIKEDK